MPSSASDLDLSSTLRAANSSLSLDLYQAPYEKRASSTNLSVVDNVTKELNSLGVSDVRPRRDTFPVSPLFPALNIELHTYVDSPSINLLGPCQLRDSNLKPSTDTPIMNKIKDTCSLSFKTISLLTRILSRPCNHPLFTNNREGRDTASQIPRVPQVSSHRPVSSSRTSGGKTLRSLLGLDLYLRPGVTA